MTEILCDWLNKNLQLSVPISPENFEKEFSNGYLIGEVLHKYELQDDFERFSKSKVSESKINNFTRVEPVLHLLGIPFDTSAARAIMTEEPGTATRLMYQIFIALENKRKANLTGVAMETMRPAAPAKLQSMESIIYRQRLKQVTPRQTDLNLQELIDRFHQHQNRLEERALKGRIESAEAHRRESQDKRQKQLDRNKQLQLMQAEQMAKIQAAIVHIPKPPPNRTEAAIEQRKFNRRRLEAAGAMRALDGFEERLSRTLQPSGESAAAGFDRPESSASEVGSDQEAAAAAAPAQQRQQQQRLTDPMEYIKPASNDAYIAKIRKRLAEDAEARAARERRRRKVLVDCLRAHEQQEEQHREASLAAKLMRQSQMERRIAVQLLQARREKDALKRNRCERERQYQERREIEFQEALDREKRLAAQARTDYEEELRQERLLREEASRQRQQERWERHYGHCQLVVQDMVDMACRLAELRELEGGGRVPYRKYRDLKAVFVSGQPFYQTDEGVPAEAEDTGERSRAVDADGADETGAAADEADAEVADAVVVLEEKEAVQDEAELLEYKDMLGEWRPPEDCEVEAAPVANPVVGWIVDRVHLIANPPTPPPEAPQFPPFPVRAAICGKLFSGKSTVIRRLIENNRCVSFDVNTLAEEAMDAFKLNELEPLPTPPPTPPPAEAEEASEAAAAGGAESSSAPLTDSAATGAAAAAAAAAAASQATLGGESAGDAQEAASEPPAPPPPPPEPPKPQLTKRAKIGEKLAGLLRRGKRVTDEVLVELLVEAIQRVPAGTGWILDGFPTTYAQAKLFEKALTGFEEPAKGGGGGRKKRGSLATNPKPAPPPPEPASGLDLVIDFGLDDAWCLKRALGRVEQPTAGRDFHLELRQPPEGSATGVQGEEKLQAVRDPAYDLDQVQERLSSYAESWPKVEKFYRRFGNVVKLDAALEPEALYLETERVLDEFVAKRLEAERREEERKAEEARAAAEALAAEQRRLEEEAAAAAAAEASAADEAARASQVASEAAAAAAEGSRPASGKRGRSKSKEKGGSRRSSRASSAEKKKGAKKGGGGGSRGGSPKSPRGGRKAAAADDKSGTSKQPVADSVAPEASADAATGAEEPPPPPKPGDSDWEFVDLAIPEDLAKALAPLWDAVEAGYVSTAKSVFRRLRQVKDSAVVYFYQVRRDFLEYLQRPDNHQVLLTAFQKDFNEIPNDLRFDEEVIADLHQRLEELRERLVDITDKRKEQAEAKKAAIEECGWVEDRLGLLVNLYIELLQGEMDRFQDTVKFMKDYYKGMDTPIPDQFKPDFLRLPIIELPYEKEPARSGEGSRASSRHQSPAKAASPVAKKGAGKKEVVDEARELTDEEIEAMFRTKIPVLGQAPTLAEFKEALQSQFKVGKEKGGGGGGGGKKDKKAERLETPAAPPDPDARVVFDAFWAGVSQIAFFVNQELAAKEAEEEAERQRLLEKEKEREKAAKEASKGAGKKGGGGGGGGGGKKGKSRSPSPKKGGKKGGGDKADDAAAAAGGAGTPDPAAEPLESEEERARRLAKERMREEYYFALEHEARGARARMELCVAVAARVLQDLKQKRELSSKDLLDWIGARLLRESELIDQACELIRHAIESRGPLVERLELSASDFLLNSEFKVVPDPPKPVRPPPVEQLEPDWFSLKAIRELLARFKGVAPDGLLAINEFVNVLLEEVSAHQDPDLLPEHWQNCSAAQLQELAQSMSSDQEYVSWRAFLLAISQPWPWPSQQNLLDTLAKFKDLDQTDSGSITREQYDFVELWFTPGHPPPTPEEPTQPKQIGRLEGFKQLLFDFFSNEDGRMPYLDLLLYCAASPSPYVGFLKALSVANDSHIPHCPIAGYEEVTTVDPLSEEVPSDCDDSLVKIDAAYYVLGYGRHITEDTTDFSDLVDTEVTQECLTRPMLGAIYHQLGSDELEPLPYTRLVKHVNFVELLLQAKQYKRVNVRDFFPLEQRSSRAPSQMQA